MFLHVLGYIEWDVSVNPIDFSLCMTSGHQTISQRVKEVPVYHCLLSKIDLITSLMWHLIWNLLNVMRKKWVYFFYCGIQCCYQQTSFLMDYCRVELKCKFFIVLRQRDVTLLTYIHQWTGSTLVRVMTCHLFGDKSLPKPIMSYYQ